eukprot:403358056
MKQQQQDKLLKVEQTMNQPIYQLFLDKRCFKVMRVKSNNLASQQKGNFNKNLYIEGGSKYLEGEVDTNIIVNCINNFESCIDTVSSLSEDIQEREDKICNFLKINQNSFIL